MWSLPPCHVILTNRSTSEGQLAFHPRVARDPSGAFSHVEPPKQSHFRPGMLLCGFSNKRWKGRYECLSIAAVLRQGQPRSGRGLNKIRTFRCTGSKAKPSKMTRRIAGGDTAWQYAWWNPRGSKLWRFLRRPVRYMTSVEPRCTGLVG